MTNCDVGYVWVRAFIALAMLTDFCALFASVLRNPHMLLWLTVDDPYSAIWPPMGHENVTLLSAADQVIIAHTASIDHSCQA